MNHLRTTLQIADRGGGMHPGSSASTGLCVVERVLTPGLFQTTRAHVPSPGDDRETIGKDRLPGLVSSVYFG